MPPTLTYGRTRPRLAPVDVLLWVVALWPVLPVVFMATEFAVAWLVLGRQPLPGRDDPKSVPYTRVLHPLTWYIVFSSGLSLVLLMPLLLWAVEARRRVLLVVVVAVAVWPLRWILLGLDPMRIMTWWLD